MILIIKEGELMLLTRQNPKGGPTLKGYPLEEDPASGMFGYKLGYCGCGCGEPVYMRSIDVREVTAKFGYSLEEYKKIFQKLKPKVPIRHRLIEALGGKIGGD